MSTKWHSMALASPYFSLPTQNPGNKCSSSLETMGVGILHRKKEACFLIREKASDGNFVLLKDLEALTSSILPQIHATLSTLQLRERRNSGQLALGGLV